jgi:hypothetical protein
MRLESLPCTKLLCVPLFVSFLLCDDFETPEHLRGRDLPHPHCLQATDSVIVKSFVESKLLGLVHSSALGLGVCEARTV